jgi:hypothetical protein
LRLNFPGGFLQPIGVIAGEDSHMHHWRRLPFGFCG